LELAPTSTIVAVFGLLALGAFLATAVILTSSQNCLSLISGSDFSMETQQALQGGDGPVTTTYTQATVLNLQDDDMPAMCTKEQVDNVKLQLKPEGCLGGRPWTQPCSFTQATRGCQDHVWMTQEYAKQNLSNFTAIFVGWPSGVEKGAMPLQAVQLGTKDAVMDIPRFLASQVTAVDGLQCHVQTPVLVGNRAQSTRVFVLEPKTDRIRELEAIRQAYSIDTDTLVLEQYDFTTNAAVVDVRSSGKQHFGTLDDWVKQKLGDDAQAAIHQLSINIAGWDFHILMGASSMLNHVRYLDFEVHWSSEWNKGSLAILVRKLKTRGFVCYFTGTNQQSSAPNLWRITNCWMTHYGEKHWGRIGCVNAHHANSKGILAAMETGFANTLTKNVAYGL
jgi:hypothetical protein